MTGKDAYQIWAPTGARWAEWVRPVPFAAMSDSLNTTHYFAIPSISYITNPQENTAIIVDLPGYCSVLEGIALAKIGFRPIPLYNGTNGQEGAMALVENHPIESALKWGAQELKQLTIGQNAPPVFLLDHNRTHQYKMDVSVFDNSWDIYPQDLPSAPYFLQNGISRIVVKGEMIQKDLGKILYEFQNKGFYIQLTDGYTPPKKVTIRKPARQKPSF